jgi:predicted phage tail protein
MLSTIRLHGVLAKRFGDELQFKVDSVREGVQALLANFKDFKSVLRQYDFRFIADGVNLDRKDVCDAVYPFKVLDIIPVTEGDKMNSNTTKAIIGGVEIAAGIVFDAFSMGTVGNPLIMAGVSTIAGAVINSFMKPPEYDQSGDAATSNIFDGARNVSKEGVAVPILYGRMKVGSLVASGFIAVDGQKI